MLINQAHYQNRLLFYRDEQQIKNLYSTSIYLLFRILIRIVNHSKNVTLSFDDSSQQCHPIFRRKHKGKVFVTAH